MNRSRGKKRAGAALAAVILMLMTAAGADAQQGQDLTTVQVIGSSRIFGDDMSAVREEAIQNGLVTAVYQVLAGILPEEAFAANFQGVSEAVFGQTPKFINNYKVLKESKFGKTYRVLIQAHLSTVRIKDALKVSGVWMDRKNLPRVLLCVAEKKIDDFNPQYWWSGQPEAGQGIAAAIMTQALTEGRFTMVQPDSGHQGMAYPPELSASEAVALGRMFDAEVVIAGLALAEALPNTMAGAAQSFRGTISVRVYRISDGQQIVKSLKSAVIAAQDRSMGGQEALHSAAVSAAQDLSMQIQDAWLREGAGSAQLELVVDGTGGNIASFVRFRGALGTISGVDNVQLKEMAANSAQLTVTYEGNARKLADALLLHNFETFRINITEVGANRIRLQLTGR